MEKLLTYQLRHQLDALQEFLDGKEIESAWDMAAIYQALLSERLDAARRRSTEWVTPRMALGQGLASLDRERCGVLERELGAAPDYLSTQDRRKVERLLESVKHRRVLLNEKERSAKVIAWQQGFPELQDMGRLDRHETERLLRELQNPPCELNPDELAQVAPVIDRLLAYLDQMSVDELAARIERLSRAQQRQLFDWLSLMLERLGS